MNITWTFIVKASEQKSCELSGLCSAQATVVSLQAIDERKHLRDRSIQFFGNALPHLDLRKERSCKRSVLDDGDVVLGGDFANFSRDEPLSLRDDRRSGRQIGRASCRERV